MDATRRTLLTRVRGRGDPRAWKEFVGLYRSLVGRYARARGLSAADAKDVAADCMDALAEHVASPDYDPSGGRFKRWLRGLVRAALRERAEAASVAPDSERQSHAEPTPDEVFERIWGDEHLRHCLEQLRIEVEFKTFEAFRRLALDQWPVERVCETYDLTPQYVCAMKSRLTQRLRRLMQSLLG